MTPHTRVDRVVWLRERIEEAALASLARARADVARAEARVMRATEAAHADARTPGPVELWTLEEDGHRRAIQALHAAAGEARQVSTNEEAARRGYEEARRDVLAVRRVQERRRAEARTQLLRRERRDLDEIATLRFTAPRWS